MAKPRDQRDVTPEVKEPDANRDPISGEPGAHPVGVGVGAAAGGLAAGVAGGAAAGAMGGTAAGPVGTAVGAAVGAVVGGVAGGLAGKSIAESIDPTTEDAYWRETYTSRPYYSEGMVYEEYRPAYQYGWESRARHEGRTWEEVESDLGRDWDRANRSKNRVEPSKLIIFPRHHPGDEPGTCGLNQQRIEAADMVRHENRRAAARQLTRRRNRQPVIDPRVADVDGLKQADDRARFGVRDVLWFFPRRHARGK